MKEFKGTKGNWQMVFNNYKQEPKKICTGVGIVEKINDSSEYTGFVCNSLLPETDKEYLIQREQIEADMKLIAAAPLMLKTLQHLSAVGGLGFDNHRYIDEAINEAL